MSDDRHPRDDGLKLVGAAATLALRAVRLMAQKPELIQGALSTAAELERDVPLRRSIRALAAPRDALERDAAMQKLRSQFLVRELRNVSSQGKESLVGFAGELRHHHSSLFETLGQTLHLGSLATLTDVPATRLDYVHLIARTLLRLKRSFPSLGLGGGGYGVYHPAKKTKELTGLEIAQTWAVLLNCGHLFGTFATERALAYHLEAAPDLQRELVRQVSSDLQLAEQHLSSLSQRRVHQFLSAWRLSRLSGSKKWADTARACFGLYLRAEVDNPKLDRLRWTFLQARRAAMQEMHALLGVMVALSHTTYQQLLDELAPYAELGFEQLRADGGRVIGLLTALEEYHYNSFFRSQHTAPLQLAHLREFKAWWGQQPKTPDTVERLFTRPEDWPLTQDPPSLTHFTRFRFRESSLGWVKEVKDWLGDDTVWSEANFLVTSETQSHSTIVDVYLHTGTPPSWPLLKHVFSLLARQVYRSWEQDNVNQAEQLWATVGRFAVRLLNSQLRGDVYAELVPANLDNRTAYAMVTDDLEAGLVRLRDICQHLKSDIRRLELEAVGSYLGDSQDAQGPWLIVLGAIIVYPPDSGDPLTDLDGVLLDCSSSPGTWHILERKDKKSNSGARTAFREVLDLLPPSLAGVSEVRTGGGLTLATTFSHQVR